MSTGTTPRKSAEGFDPNRIAKSDIDRVAEAIHLAFREDYAGDRVLAFVVGLGGMVQTAFNDKTNRTLAKVFRNLATAIFLPVKF